MIDEKKIEEAAQAICFDDKMSYYSYCKIEGFRKGAKWAINEFLKDLWHQTDEEPERMKEILAYGFYGTTIVRWCPNGYITWKDYYEKWHYTQWLYVSDLLPKEGGEQ